MARSNAERQQAYRERRRNGRNAAAPPISVTAAETGRDRVAPNGDQLLYLGDWGFGARYARVITTQRCGVGRAAAERNG